MAKFRFALVDEEFDEKLDEHNNMPIRGQTFTMRH